MTQLPPTADTVIVGAGVMGCSIAYHLAKAGVRDVVVVERDHVCAGNTRKSGALVRMHSAEGDQIRPGRRVERKGLEIDAVIDRRHVVEIGASIGVGDRDERRA